MERPALSAELGVYLGWRLRIPIYADHCFQRTSAPHSDGTRSPFLSFIESVADFVRTRTRGQAPLFTRIMTLTL